MVVGTTLAARRRGTSTGTANEPASDGAQSQASPTVSPSASATAPGLGPIRYTVPQPSDTTYSFPSGPFSRSVITLKPAPKMISAISAEQIAAPLSATRSRRPGKGNDRPSPAAVGPDRKTRPP